MYSFILFLHLIICITLIGLVLLQRGKGADVGASFGAGASSTMFGAAGSTSFLVKLTAIFGVLFFITSLTLGVFASKIMVQNNPVQDALKAAGQVQASLPQAPAATAPVTPVGSEKHHS